ncbi:hypothetical protein MMC20_004506 [Loxospora ochrophaea]|nr:hypothetical protein [Loxospora ochrophaea]
MRGFNSQETREALQKGYQSVSPEVVKTMRYKAPAGQSGNAKAGGPWASKSNAMGNGKDFFLELRKQISALQHTGERAGG